jgi:hypothetical protein
MEVGAPRNEPHRRVSLDDDQAPSGRRSIHILSRPGHYVILPPLTRPSEGVQAAQVVPVISASKRTEKEGPE